MTSELCPATGLPIGLPVQQVAQPKYPAHCTLPGRFVTLVPLVADKHANGLYAETHGSESGAYWQYMGDGPYPDFESFEASMRGKAASTDPLFFVVMCNSSHQPLGYLTLMRIDVANRVVEVTDCSESVVYQSAFSGCHIQRTSPGCDDLSCRRDADSIHQIFRFSFTS